MIEVIPTVAMQNNKNSTIGLYGGYRTQLNELLVKALADLDAAELVEPPLLQVGQL
jgi:hypothetical protein